MAKKAPDARAAFVTLIASRYNSLPPIAARIFATLLTADESALTAAELASRLAVSAGSVSTMTRYLEQQGLVERSRRPGERADYFSPRVYTSAMIDGLVETMDSFRELTDAIPADLSEEAVKRVRSLIDIYVQVADRLRSAR